MEDKKKSPDLCFEGFTEDWTEKELSSVALFNPKEELPSTFEYVDLESVVGTQMISHRKENKESAPSRAQRLAKFNDVFYQTVRPYQKNNYLFDKKANNFVFSTGYAQMRPYGDSRFLFSLVQTSDFVKIVLDNCTGTSYPAISSSDLAKIKQYFPEQDEQQQIGSFFKNIDELITKHQKKHNRLVTLKKSMLEKMFPKEGQTVPEIRFRGFKGDWKLMSIDQMADRYDNLRVPIKAELRVSGKTPYYGANGIQDYVKGYTHKGEFVLVAEDGANDLKHYPIQYVDGEVWVNNHAHVLQAKKSIAENLFFKYSLATVNIEPFLTGGGRAKLNAEVMMKIEVSIPLDINEQKKLGEYFQSIESLINNHQKQLQKLKNFKQSLSEKMFV